MGSELRTEARSRHPTDVIWVSDDTNSDQQPWGETLYVCGSGPLSGDQLAACDLEAGWVGEEVGGSLKLGEDWHIS